MVVSEVLQKVVVGSVLLKEGQSLLSELVQTGVDFIDFCLLLLLACEVLLQVLGVEDGSQEEN